MTTGGLHARQVRFRLASTRASRAFFRDVSSSVGMLPQVPKYISSGMADVACFEDKRDCHPTHIALYDSRHDIGTVRGV